jgi:hypothetical protein
VRHRRERGKVSSSQLSSACERPRKRKGMEKWKWVGHWACVLAGSAQAQHITWAESRTPRCPLLSLPALAHNRATELEPNLLPIHACAVLACLLRCAAQALALPREITAAGPSHTRPFPHPLLFCIWWPPSHHHLSSSPPPSLDIASSSSSLHSFDTAHLSKGIRRSA